MCGFKTAGTDGEHQAVFFFFPENERTHCCINRGGSNSLLAFHCKFPSDKKIRTGSMDEIIGNKFSW